jgi:hypothetical protein
MGNLVQKPAYEYGQPLNNNFYDQDTTIDTTAASASL